MQPHQQRVIEKAVPADALAHTWQFVKMADGRTVKRCSECWMAYEYGHDIPCPPPKVRKFDEA